MKTIDKLMDEYRQGLINIDQLEYDLETLRELEEFGRDVDEERLRNKLINQNIPYGVKTPEEIVLENERMDEILHFFGWLRKVIGDKDWQVLCWYVVDGWSQKRIAEELDVNFRTVSDRLKRIYKKIQRYTEFSPVSSVYIEGSLQPPESRKEADSPDTMGYPFEFLQKVNKGGHWYIRKDGRKTFVSQAVCLIPEYLGQSYNGENTWCTLCMNDTTNKCKRVSNG